MITLPLPAGDTLWTLPGALIGNAPELRTSPQRLPGGFPVLCCTSDQETSLALSPAVPGDARLLSLAQGERWFVLSGAWLAASSSLTLDAAWGGAEGFVSGQRLLSVEGPGSLLIAGAGSLRELDASQGIKVSPEAVAAFSAKLQYEVLPSDAGLCRFIGRGTLFLQHRPHQAIARWAQSFRKQRGA